MVVLGETTPYNPTTLHASRANFSPATTTITLAVENGNHGN